MHAGRGLLVLLSIASLAIAACDDAPERAERPPSPADVVPRDATLYVEATIRLTGSTGRQIRRFGERLLGDGAVPEDALIDLIAQLADAEIDFDELEPWLGRRAAAFLAERGDEAVGGVLLETRDPRRAARFLREELGAGPRQRRYKGVSYWRSDDRLTGVVGRHALIAESLAGFRAAVDARARPLSASERYRRAAGHRPNAALMLLDGGALTSGLGGFIRWTPAERRQLRRFIDPERDLTVRLSVSERRALAEIQGTLGHRRRAEPIAALPDDSWLAASSGNLSNLMLSEISGRPLAELLGVVSGTPLPRDVFRRLRQGSVYVRGTPLAASGKLVAEVADRTAARRAIVHAGRALRRAGRHHVYPSRRPGRRLDVLPKGYAGGAGNTMALLKGREFTLEFGPGGGGGQLRDSETYRRAGRALGEPPTILFDVQRFLEESRATAPMEAGPFDRVAFLAAAERYRSEVLRYTIAVELVPGDPPEGSSPSPTPEA